MQFPSSTHPVTGISIPVGALKTSKSCGIGEFLDLIPFADFCKQAGIDLIQLLPVNDTGTESSPYSALSAFALHPVYMRLDALPEAAPFLTEIHELADLYEYQPRFSYREIRDAKLALLRLMFNTCENGILADPELAAWISENPWIVEYAVFMNQKRRNFESSWKSWERMRTPTHLEISERWNNPSRRSDHLFFAWVQMRLEGQFRQAVAACAKNGVALKGDIPIMMNEDSCDAWANPEFFRDDLRAGSPPDGPNPLGQNWGFPIYNWDNLRNDGYRWWKDRLANCAKYYNAYRIDHILGFFRIWSIPFGERSGYLGWATPHTPITQRELAERGFSGDRLRWICEPHVPTRIVQDAIGGDYLGAHGIMRKLMNRIGNEELWLFGNDVHHETDIRDADIPEAAKEALCRAWKNRMMQVTGRDATQTPLYAPVWEFRNSTAWGTLSESERQSMEALIREKADQDELLWKEQAEELLGTLTRSVDMLACAEDLGTIPACVPGVLEELGILGLKVIRWERRWNEDGQPFKRIDEYPALSVATTSVHDSSTLRGWWEQENGAQDFLASWNPERCGWPEGTSDRFRMRYGPEVAEYVLRTLAATSSELLVLPVQDVLALSAEYYRFDANAERINIPGSVTDFNWTYRLPETIEKMLTNTQLISAIQNAFKERRSRAAKKGALK